MRLSPLTPVARESAYDGQHDEGTADDRQRR